MSLQIVFKIVTMVSDLNDRDQVVGTLGGIRAFLWEPERGLRELRRLTRNGESYANAINERGTNRSDISFLEIRQESPTQRPRGMP